MASNFRKNKIWLRRTMPDKRNYQIMIALDDSLSMKDQGVGYLALESLSVLGMALNKVRPLFNLQLDISQMIIGKITNTLEILHNTEEQFSFAKCEQVSRSFSFAYEEKNSADLVRPYISRFRRWLSSCGGR